MNILYYNLQLGCFDGSNSHAMGMLCALRHLYGEDNVVVANAYEQQTYRHGVTKMKSELGPILDIPRLIRKHRSSVVSVRKICRRVSDSDFRPDVLLARSTLYDTAPISVAKELGCPLITEANTPLEYECCDVRHASLRPLVCSFEKKLYDTSRGVYVVSSTLERMLAERYGIPHSKMRVIPNGYSYDLYSDFDRRDSIRQRVREAEGVAGAFVVTFVGSLQTWHGIDRLIAIAERLKNIEGAPIVFWVLGDGAKREAVKSYADISDNFIWFGNVDPDRMHELLYASDLGVMPYDPLDSFYFSPLKMYDMIGAGLPYIALNIGQIAEETPEPMRASCLIDSVDPDAYARSIIKMRDGGITPAVLESIQIVRSGCSWIDRARDLGHWIEGMVDVA